MDNNSNNKSTEKWKVAAKRNNCQRGNNKKNGDKSKDSPVNEKISRKFIGDADTGALKGKVVTAEEENSATQFKSLVEAGELHFGSINGKVGKAIGNLTNLQKKDFTPKPIDKSEYKDKNGDIDQTVKKAIEEIHAGLNKNSIKQFGEYKMVLERAFFTNMGQLNDTTKVKLGT